MDSVSIIFSLFFLFVYDRKLKFSVYGKCHSGQNFMCCLCLWGLDGVGSG